MNDLDKIKKIEKIEIADDQHIDIVTLIERANEYAEGSISKNTRLAYRADWRHFLDFCDRHNLKPLPASPECVVLYLSDIADKLAISTIYRRLSSIRKAHELSQFSSPTKTIDVETVLSGIKRKHGYQIDKATPILWRDLKKMVDLIRNDILGVRDKSILLFGWCSAMRRSELVAMQMHHISYVDQGIEVLIPRSKTDQDGQGQTIGIPYGEEGYCPIAALSEWFQRASIADGFVFRSIGYEGRGKWTSPIGDRISDRSISEIVKRYAKKAGLQGDFSGHSLRRGISTEAASRGIPTRDIGRHNRQSSDRIVEEYIDKILMWTNNPLSVIYGQQKGDN